MSIPAQLIRVINTETKTIKVFNPISENNYLMVIYYEGGCNWNQKQIKTELDENIILFGNIEQIKNILT